MKIRQSICVAGKNIIAIKALKYLINNFKNLNIFYLPNISDTGKNSWQPSFKKFAKFTIAKLTNEDELYKIKNLIFISLEYEKIIDVNKYQSNRLFNIHFSLLPKYKGMYTSALPLLNGDKISGVTLHKIDRGIDTGNIVCQKKFKIKQNMNALDLYEKYLYYSYQIFKDNINNIIKNKIKILKQSANNSTYYSKSHINFKNLIIDYKKTAFQIQNQLRAYTFRPFQMPSYNGWKINKSRILKSRSIFKPGKLIQQTDKYFRIASIDYDILIYKDYYSKFWCHVRRGDLKDLIKISKYINNPNLKNKFGKDGYEIARAHGQLSNYKTFLNFRKK
jgi:methionyl-tRNA formyltransferase